MKLQENYLPIIQVPLFPCGHPSFLFLPLPTRKGCFAWPSLLQLFTCAEKMNLRKEVGVRQGGKEQSMGGFSVFLCVLAMGEMAYIFLLGSIKITCYTSKDLSLSKGSSSCISLITFSPLVAAS